MSRWLLGLQCQISGVLPIKRTRKNLERRGCCRIFSGLKSKDLKNLGIRVPSGRVVTDVHSVNIGGRKEQEMLLTRNDSVEILVMVLVE